VAIQAWYTKTLSKGTELALFGVGRLTIPCRNLGDFYVGGTATVTGLKLGGNQLTINGTANLSSDCGSLFMLTVVISVHALDHRGIEVLPDVWVSVPALDLRVQSLAPGELDIGLVLALGDTGELFANFSLPSGAVTVGVNFRDDTICTFMADLVRAVPGAASEPCDDMRSGELGFAAKALDSIPVRFLTVRFSYDVGMHLIVWLDGMMVGTLKLSIRLIISRVGAAKRFFWLLKFDVPDVIKLPEIFGDARTEMEDVINTGLSMMDTVKSIGFLYTSDRFVTFPQAAAELMPPGLEDMSAGLTLAGGWNKHSTDQGWTKIRNLSFCEGESECPYGYMVVGRPPRAESVCHVTMSTGIHPD